MPIERYRLYFDVSSPLPASLAYPLYAELLRRAPADFGAQVHQIAFTPVAHQVTGSCWQVSLLGQPAIDALGPVLQQARQFSLHKYGQSLQVTHLQCDCIARPDALFAAPLRQSRLVLQTPTAFKSGGEYQMLPTQRLVLQSLLQRWNGCFTDCPIEDEGGGLEQLAAGLVYTQVSLCSQPYRIKGQDIPGVTGQLGLELHHTGFHIHLCSALLRFAPYAGLGIKTGLGMGGAALL